MIGTVQQSALSQPAIMLQISIVLIFQNPIRNIKVFATESAGGAQFGEVAKLFWMIASENFDDESRNQKDI